MLRKITLTLAAGAVAGAVALAGISGAATSQVKGKFKPEASGSPVLGSARARPLGDNVWRAGVTLQHVWRADYQLYVGSFVDANGDGLPEGAEVQSPVLVAACDLSQPTPKGHDGCQGDVTLVGKPYVAELVSPDNTVPVALSLLK